MPKSFTVIVATIAAALLGGVCTGAGLDPSRVSATAGWVVHCDVDHLKKTDVGGFILDQLETEDAKRKLAAFKVIFAFDPRTDIRDVTLCGQGGGSPQGLAMFRGSFDTTQLLTLLRANASYDANAHGGHTIHQWIDEKKNTLSFGAVHADGTVLVSDAAALVRKGLDVLDGKAPSLVAGEAFNGLLPDHKAAFVVAGADLAGMALSPSASTLQQVSSGSLTLGETGGQVEARLQLKAHDAAAAEQLANVVRGILAFAALGEQANPGAAMLARRATVSTAGGTITLGLTAPAQEVIGVLEDQQRRDKARKGDGGATADGMQ